MVDISVSIAIDCTVACMLDMTMLSFCTVLHIILLQLIQNYKKWLFNASYLPLHYIIEAKESILHTL